MCADKITRCAVNNRAFVRFALLQAIFVRLLIILMRNSQRKEEDRRRRR